jgi:hypothetical protein
MTSRFVVASLGVLVFHLTSCGRLVPFSSSNGGTNSNSGDQAARADGGDFEIESVAFSGLPKEFDSRDEYVIEFNKNGFEKLEYSIREGSAECGSIKEGSSWLGSESPVKFGPISDGTYSLCFRLSSASSQRYSRAKLFTKDSIKPEAELTGFPSDNAAARVFSLSGIADDDWAKVYFALVAGDFNCDEFRKSEQVVKWTKGRNLRIPILERGGKRSFCWAVEDKAGNLSEIRGHSWLETLPLGKQGFVNWPQGPVLSNKTLELKPLPGSAGSYRIELVSGASCGSNFGNWKFSDEATNLVFAKEGSYELCAEYASDKEGKGDVELSVAQFTIDWTIPDSSVEGLPSVPFSSLKALSLRPSKEGLQIAATLAEGDVDCPAMDTRLAESSLEIAIEADGLKTLCYVTESSIGSRSAVNKIVFTRDTVSIDPIVSLKSSMLLSSDLGTIIDITGNEITSESQVAMVVVDEGADCPAVSTPPESPWRVSSITKMIAAGVYLLDRSKSWVACLRTKDRADNWSAVVRSQPFGLAQANSPLGQLSLPLDFSSPTKASTVAVALNGPSGAKLYRQSIRKSSLNCSSTPTLVPSGTDPCAPCLHPEVLPAGYTMELGTLDQNGKGTSILPLTDDGFYRHCIATVSANGGWGINVQSVQFVKDTTSVAPTIVFPVADRRDSSATSYRMSVSSPEGEILTQYAYIVFSSPSFFDVAGACPLPNPSGAPYFSEPSSRLPFELLRSPVASPISIGSSVNIQLLASQQGWKRLCVIGRTSAGVLSTVSVRRWLFDSSPPNVVVTGGPIDGSTEFRLPISNIQVSGARQYAFYVAAGSVVCNEAGYRAGRAAVSYVDTIEEFDITLQMLYQTGAVRGQKTLCVRGIDFSFPGNISEKRIVWNQEHRMLFDSGTVAPSSNASALDLKVLHSAVASASERDSTIPRVDMVFQIASSAQPFATDYCQKTQNPFLSERPAIPFDSNPSMPGEQVAVLSEPLVIYIGKVGAGGKVRTIKAAVGGPAKKALCVWGRDSLGNVLAPAQLNWTRE